MTVLKRWTSLSKAYRTLGEFYSSLRTRHVSLRRRPSLPQPNEAIFCNGRCTEATCFEDLCQSCISEYHEYMAEREAAYAH
jgi:hypothetical protein